MSSPILQAIEQVCEEKGLPKEKVIETIEAALAAAYRKDFHAKDKNIKVVFDATTGSARVFDEKEVVEDIDLDDLEEKRLALREKKELAQKEGDEGSLAQIEEEEKELPRFNPKSQIMLSEAKEKKKDAAVGDIITTELPVTEEYGRVAAQTAKQVIIQRLREVEREIIFEEFKNQEGELINGVVQRQEGNVVLVDIGRTTGLLLPSDRMRNEIYRPGQRMRFFVKEVRIGGKGPEIYLSRTHPEMIRKIFELEVPEIASGTVEIKAIAREAESRSKIAVATSQDNIDPVGSCVGQRGTRVQTVINELGGEKIDIIEWNEDDAQFIAHALSPARIAKVDLEEETRKAKVFVSEDQLSLAIGKAGQNVRLAAKLTGWKIDIASEDEKVLKDEDSPDSEAAGEAEGDKDADKETASDSAEEKSKKEEGKKEKGKKKEKKEKKEKEKKEEDEKKQKTEKKKADQQDEKKKKTDSAGMENNPDEKNSKA